MNYKKLAQNAVKAAEETRLKAQMSEQEKVKNFLLACRTGDMQLVSQYITHDMEGRVNKPVLLGGIQEVNPILPAIKGEQEQVVKYILEHCYLLGLSKPLVKAAETGNFNITKMIADAGTLVNFDKEDIHQAIKIATEKGYTGIVKYLKDKLDLPHIEFVDHSFMPFPYTTLTDTLERYKRHSNRSWNMSDTSWNQIIKTIEKSAGVKQLFGCAAIDRKPPYYKDLVYTASNLYHFKYWGYQYVALFALLILDYWRKTLGQGFSVNEIDAVARQALADMSNSLKK